MITYDLWNDQPVKAVLFDMDGIIFDTEALAQRSWFIAANKMGYPMTHEIFCETLGLNRDGTRGVMLRHLGEGIDYPKFLEHRLIAMEDMLKREGIPVKPGFERLIRHLQNRGIKRAIATSSYRTRVDQYFEMAGLDLYDFYDGVVGGDMIENGKPAPDIYLKAAQLLEVAPEGCIVLEDSFGGIQSGFSAGMRVVMVPDMLPPDEGVQGKLAAQVATLDGVIDLLESINGA